MAAVPRFGAGDSTTATAASGTGSALSVAKPTNVAIGDLLIGNFYSQFSGSVVTPPSGWTLVKAWASRSGGVYRLAIPDQAALDAVQASWSQVVSGSGRLCYEVFRVTGADLSAPIDVVGAEASQNSLASFALPSVSPTNAGGLLLAFAYWNNSSTTQSTYTPDAAMTDGEQVKSPATGNTSGIDVSYQQLGSAGATGTRTVSMSPTGASNGGFMLVVKAKTGSSYSATADAAASASTTANGSNTVAGAAAQGASVSTGAAAQLTTAVQAAATVSVSTTADAVLGGGLSAAAIVPVTTSADADRTVAASAAQTVSVVTTASASRIVNVQAAQTVTVATTASTQTAVDRWIASRPLYAAHRGGSADWVEHTMNAYDRASAWNRDLALEVSVWKTSDNVWVCSHDQSTLRVFGVDHDITATAWSTLAGLTTTVGGFPILRLDTLLAKYGGKRVIVIDDKGSQDPAGLIALLGSYGGVGWYIGKSYYTAAAWPAAMRSAGHRTLGYYYDADAAQIASTQSKFDVLMEDQSASSTSWATILAYPQPVMAHIIATSSQKTAAAALGAEGYMASGVMEVVPTSGLTADQVVAIGTGATAVRTTSVTAASTVTATSDAAAQRVVGGTAAAIATAVTTADAAIVRPAAADTTVTAVSQASAARSVSVTAAAVASVSSDASAQVTRAAAADAVVSVSTTATMVTSGQRDITVLVDGPYRHPLQLAGVSRNPLTVSGATT